MFWVQIDDFEAICFNFCTELFTFNEPIPKFTTRYSGILESCLNSPLQQAFGNDLYPEFNDKLAILFYLLSKNHPFVNGNKRMAVTTLLVTLYGNNKWMKATSEEVYEIAVKVSESKPRDKDKIIVMIKDFLNKNISEKTLIDKLLELINK
ncbi:MAG TPA: type II toxin-antitoxin system death-on-curing family toxin [Patescibacteria group bacterium]|nr:type II toxin-antitoxin system death-on-curing family toxin [Patescibacteria group bacterium]